jgi:hypothetical protein
MPARRDAGATRRCRHLVTLVCRRGQNAGHAGRAAMSNRKLFWALICNTDRRSGSDLGLGCLPADRRGSRKLICMLPQALGSSGFNYALFGILNNRRFPNIRPITQAVRRASPNCRSHLRPRGSASTYDTALKTFIRSSDDNLSPHLRRAGVHHWPAHWPERSYTL